MTEEQETHGSSAALNWRTVALAGALGGLSLAALVIFHDPAPPASRFTVASAEEATPAPPAPDPLMAELMRCRSLPAGSDDAACRAAWELNRRRFMGESRSLVVPAPIPSDPASAGSVEGR